MSKPKVTPYELESKIYNEIGDPGGLGIYFVRTDDGGWFFEVRDGSELIPESGFQAAVDQIVDRLRLQYDLCPYSDVRPMHAENARRHARLTWPPGHYLRDRAMQYAQQAEVGPHAPHWVRYREFRKRKYGVGSH
jgi:hypothetical protein